MSDSRLTTHDSRLLSVLKQYWGYEQFRPLQEEIIQSVLAKKDVLALMPTGGGKSLCYQVPTMVNEGMCLVISPLIALMKDQVENLRKKGITAYAIFSGMTRKEVMNVLKVVTESNCKFLYVSPERLETKLFKEFLPGMNIRLVAVDEAHCISQWGYDFRPPYLRIAAIREELRDVPVLALTASATAEVQQDICERLSFAEKNIFRQSFERSNLSYSVFEVHSKINKITEIIQKVNGSGIIYCKSRKRTQEISDLLKLHGISADYYHAGLPQDERSKKQESWIANKTRIIVCTNAFGMGIDKPDVRFVIHADVPDSLENYYQEAGRAGRDGKTAYAVLLYDEKDLVELEEAIAQRFPSLESIREVYQSIANYLQLHTGDGEGQYYEFDISDFLRKFRLQSHTVIHALKALEQDGWLAFNEQVFRPSQVQFTTDKRYLYDFEQSHPLLEPLIKMLLRAYEGIFDVNVGISEKLLAGLLKKEVDVVKQQLQELHNYRLLDYQPQKDTPQLYFLKPRIKTENLSIDMVAYEQRRLQYEKRCRQMISYVKEKQACRSQLIGQYFGDTGIKPCGICDNCLEQKKSRLSKEEFEQIRQQVMDLLEQGQLPVKDLLIKLGDIKKEKAWKVIEFLQAESKIVTDAEGRVGLK